MNYSKTPGIGASAVKALVDSKEWDALTLLREKGLLDLNMKLGNQTVGETILEAVPTMENLDRVRTLGGDFSPEFITGALAHSLVERGDVDRLKLLDQVAAGKDLSKSDTFAGFVSWLSSHPNQFSCSKDPTDWRDGIEAHAKTTQGTRVIAEKLVELGASMDALGLNELPAWDEIKVSREILREEGVPTVKLVEREKFLSFLAERGLRPPRRPSLDI
jgi:hypothetical protein